MARQPSKTEIKELLDEYARLELRRLEIEIKRDENLAPLKADYEKKAAPINAAAAERLKSVNERLAVLSGQLSAEMMSGVDQHAETVALERVEAVVETKRFLAAAIARLNGSDAVAYNESNKPIVRAVVQVDAKPGNREVDAQAFFDQVPAARRNETFWKKCLKVMVGEADKFLGKETVDKLAKVPKRFGVSLSLRP